MTMGPLLPLSMKTKARKLEVNCLIEILETVVLSCWRLNKNTKISYRCDDKHNIERKSSGKDNRVLGTPLLFFHAIML